MRDQRFKSAFLAIALGVMVLIGIVTSSSHILNAEAAVSAQYNTSEGTNVAVFHCVDAQAQTIEAYWIDVHDYDELSLEVAGITAATIQVRGTNRTVSSDPGLGVPVDTFDGFQIGSDITTDGATTITAVPFFVKIMITAWTEGAIDVYLLAK